ncbi:relaxin receptor 1-like protein [Dinothrombium tinctorium]|uniref:Relaxin receptor 1-like protein n=1 Tax=Dinothrombium tinctorium TaxID=1965070 RepID=A0A3S3PXX2_9ACAR|nr:relaxin receptor 1-like protein [Dinothrombium tinctorium]RWS10210.1 relaxin receptor 1-like protein [Dinothrombium tinctorium]RWS10557.1 relaxin receptor 1-like protein [Dinothrombium tinctorium]
MFNRYFSEFRHCLRALHARVCEPRGDGISSVAHLLDNVLLRVSVWIMAVVACCGNLSVLLGRLIIREPNVVHSLFIKNLAVSDFLMGIYLIIIAVNDIKYREVYIKYEFEWRHSWQCSLAGFLSTLSCEASVLIVTIITLDRYFSIVRPLMVRKRSKKFAWTLLSFVWFAAFVFSFLPLLPIAYFGDEYYGSNGVCIPFHIHNPFSEGWEYSLLIFCVVNTINFVFVLFAYLHMFVTISKSASGLRICSLYQHDRVITKRFAFIVGFQFICWIPIMIIKFIALAGINIDESLYAWLAIFLLPVNSALNPVLYTLTTRLFKQQFSKFVYSWRSTPSMTMEPLQSNANRNLSLRNNVNSLSDHTN